MKTYFPEILLALCIATLHDLGDSRELAERLGPRLASSMGKTPPTDARRFIERVVQWRAGRKA